MEVSNYLAKLARAFQKKSYAQLFTLKHLKEAAQHLFTSWGNTQLNIIMSV